jgi:integrase
MTPASTRNTVKVIARHRPECPVKDTGIVGDLEQFPELARCKCPKALLIYQADTKKQNMESAHTISWNVAEQRAKEVRDRWDPEKQELLKLRAAKEAKQVTLAEAVALYCADLITRKRKSGTVAMARSLFGHVDPQSKDVLSNGHFFNWLATIPPDKRPAHVADITPQHLTEWRSAWRFGSDLTAAQRWTMVKAFFSFCESQGWIDDSPASKIKSLKVAEGNRTAIFTDDEYSAILDAVSIYDPENVPEATREGWQQRATTFIELLRWSGMDLIDAVQYRPELVDKEGVLRYRRQKTGKWAIVPLPAAVVALLRDIPMERDSVGPEQPFRCKDTIPDSDTRKWQNRLNQIFKLAGITEVRTDHRIRRPHPKMLRDTFAVGHLRNGVPIYSVAKMLGHSKTDTTERAYLPYCKELDEAHIAVVRKMMDGAAPKATNRKIVNIANR